MQSKTVLENVLENDTILRSYRALSWGKFFKLYNFCKLKAIQKAYHFLNKLIKTNLLSCNLLTKAMKLVKMRKSCISIHQFMLTNFSLF